jgi:hypothetical protein
MSREYHMGTQFPANHMKTAASHINKTQTQQAEGLLKMLSQSIQRDPV